MLNTLLKKLIRFIPTNIGAILGVIQAIIKFVKEIATLAVDIIAPLTPGDKDDKIILWVRDMCNKVDEVVEKIKGFLLKMGK